MSTGEEAGLVAGPGKGEEEEPLLGSPKAAPRAEGLPVPGSDTPVRCVWSARLALDICLKCPLLADPKVWVTGKLKCPLLPAFQM